MKNAMVYIILIILLSLPEICFSQSCRLFPVKKHFYTRSSIRSCPIVQSTINPCRESSMANRDQTELDDLPFTILYALSPAEDDFIHYYTELYDREGLSLRLHDVVNRYESYLSPPESRRVLGIEIIYGEKNKIIIVTLSISRRNTGDGDNDYYLYYSSNFNYVIDRLSGTSPTGLPKRRSDIAGEKDKAIEDVVNYIFTWIEQIDKRLPPLAPRKPQTLRNAKGEYYTPL